MSLGCLDEYEGDPSFKNLTSDFGKIPEKQSEILQTFGAPHVDSFNYLLREGLQKAAEDIMPAEFLLPNNDRLSMKFEGARILPPCVPSSAGFVIDSRLFPSECRRRAATYAGQLMVDVSWKLNGIQQNNIQKDLGRVPIVVKSDACHLSKLSPEELVAKGEHTDEWGGYFIIKGHERLIRMLQMTRRNYPIALQRSSWRTRGSNFTDMGIQIRCVKEDLTSVNNVLHFIKDGSVRIMFNYGLSLYYAPVVLIMKCLVDVPDEFILQRVMTGYEEDTYLKGCMMKMLRIVHEESIHTQAQAKAYIGKTFRVKLQMLAPWKTDVEICNFILEKCFLIHLDDPEDKFNLLILMLQKLFTFVQKKTSEESVDCIVYHELLLGGHLYLQVLKDRMNAWLFFVRNLILKKLNEKQHCSDTVVAGVVQEAMSHTSGIDNGMEKFVATGNLKTRWLNVMQDKGLTILCDNINRMRYMAHFRSVHRGNFFLQMRVSDPRQLLPEAWGFICPVHTPDGEPCGLLNHLTKHCEATPVPDPELVAGIPSVLVALGMIPLGGINVSVHHEKQYVTMLDGRVLGYVKRDEAQELIHKLRLLKIAGVRVPKTLEICLMPMGRKCGQFPGLHLFTGPARMMRPVINLAARQIELIGTMEQVYLDICVYPEEAYAETTHQEISDTSFLSHLACLIPMPDCNQSPRNMYQCQMGKQTMGTSLHILDSHVVQKVYRLQTPMSPFFRPFHYDLLGLDDFAMGVNAMVAVISYTGYDMEDAMIINKSSYERGFGHGSVYTAKCVNLETKDSYFGVDPSDSQLVQYLDSDGMPYVGSLIKEGQPYCSFYSSEKTAYRVEKWSSNEDAYVDSVRLCSGVSSRQKPMAYIIFRIPRNPTVGDKFASRAGQKGICSYLWPAEDLPYTETGIIPDIVFNPHGFPSRMTIAMMIEVMAGKSAALHGLMHDATPFRFSEKNRAIDYFGKLLEEAGYNYYSTEKMYSGIDGRELNADIFFGVVHYQRLRHMVSDKWQVRSTGSVDMLTQQPVKGRRRGGGVRFGEMERDALLSHGASFLLQDRLFYNSDKTTMMICKTCGNILAPVMLSRHRNSNMEKVVRCQICKENGNVQDVDIPYIFRFLVAQLASVNIKIHLDVKEH